MKARKEKIATSEVIGQNLRQLRAAKRLSQKALAAAADVSIATVKNLELAKREPRTRTLLALAKALGVRLNDLVTPTRGFRTVRFRSGKRMRSREHVLAVARRWLDDFNFLEKALEQRKRFILDSLRGTRSDPERAALHCRHKLGLDEEEPIHDICGLLEDAGVKVLPIDITSEGFFGLSIGPEDGGPGIVVNVSRDVPVERRIFSAAHELGHLILHPDAFDVSKTGENKEEERDADCFAGCLLMPEAGFRKHWLDTAGLALVDRVFKVKRIFHVSYKTVLHRLTASGRADENLWRIFHLAYQRQSGRKLRFGEEPEGIGREEPCGLKGCDFYEGRFSRLVREALDREAISLSRAAEMLRIDIGEMRDRSRSWAAVG